MVDVLLTTITGIAPIIAHIITIQLIAIIRKRKAHAVTLIKLTIDANSTIKRMVAVKTIA